MSSLYAVKHCFILASNQPLQFPNNTVEETLAVPQTKSQSKKRSKSRKSEVYRDAVPTPVPAGASGYAGQGVSIDTPAAQSISGTPDSARPDMTPGMKKIPGVKRIAHPS